ncbi:MAG TPA: sugar transferase [Chloroflexota bacterium]|nr:sugar transferase [Chloroflexota bacterium]
MTQPALALERPIDVSPALPLTRGWISPVISWAIDLVLLNVAFVLAYWIRYPLGFPSHVSVFDYRPLIDFTPMQLSLTLIAAIILPATGLYRRVRGAGWLSKLPSIFGGTTVSVCLLIVLSYLSRLYADSRGVYIIAWALIVVLLALDKACISGVRAALHKRGIGVENLVIVGGSDMAKMMMQHVAAEPGLGYRLLGFLDDYAHPDGRFGRFSHLGRIDQLAGVVETFGVSEVIIALPTDAHQKVWDIVNRCEEHNVRYKVVPDLFEMSLSRVDVDEIAGIPLIGFRESTIAGPNLVLKRTLDLFVGSLMLLVSLPLWLIIPLLIKLDSPGPVLFRQIRVGRDGKHFKFYKFRSMRQGAEEEWHRLRSLNETEGPILKIRNDPRLTRVGKFLRRTSIDELPQLLNVLRGDMSLVGPRPPLPAEVLQYDSWQHKRLAVAGGMTGLWQVSGRSHLNFEEMVLMDLYYIENWSLGLDLKILLRTIPAILTATGSF